MTNYRVSDQLLADYLYRFRCSYAYGGSPLLQVEEHDLYCAI